PAQPPRSAGGRGVGSREGRSRRRTVQGLRRARPYARADPDAHLVAGRQHAEARDRLRHSDTPPALWRRGGFTAAKLAGRHIGGVAGARRRPRLTALRLAQDGDDEPACRLSAEEWRAIRRARGVHRELGRALTAEWRSVSGQHQRCRRPGVSAGAVSDGDSLQARTRYVQVGSNAMRCKVLISVVCASTLLACVAPASAQVELGGTYAIRMYEDYIERGPGSFLGDFTGMPLSDEGRAKALSYSSSLPSTIERQCLAQSPWVGL